MSSRDFKSRTRRAVPVVALALVMLVPTLAHADNCEFASYEQRGIVWMFLGAFGFGFLTSLTPCVYPMIPITLAIFGARGAEASKRKALALAASYVSGMCLTYATLGVTFAMVGKAGDFGTQLSSPWVVFPLVALFLALALSMFGLFDLNLPSSWQAKLNQVGGKGYRGAFAMGLVGGLIAAPCTGPFLAGLLAYVTTTASVVTGGALLYVYGLGMGVLFFVLAVFAVGLPKSGRWMDAVKSIGGIGLLLAAIYYLQPFLPWLKHLARPSVTFVTGALVLGIAGIALGAIHLSFHGGTSERIRKAIGVALVVCGALGVWLWKLAPKQLLPYEHDEVAAFAQARAQHKGVMVDFSAEWCMPCREMERTFGDAEVFALITDNFVPLKFDVTAGTDEDLARRTKYGAETLPAVLFLDTDGNVLQRVKKMTEVDEMRELVVQATKRTALATAAPCTH
jgi:thiol:disulfide interchange protein DsbD